MSDQEQPDVFDLRIKSVMESIQKALKPNEEDVDNNSLIEALQQHRSMILDVATSAYINRKNDPKLLEAVTSLIGQLEKSVRDDRKERAKKDEQTDNKLAFRQVVDLLGSLSSGAIALPSFEQRFNFDPLGDNPVDLGEFKIKESELEQGHITLDFDGNKI